MQVLRKALCCACSVFVLSGCTGSLVHKKGQLGDIAYLSVDARQRLVLSGMRYDRQTGDFRQVTCTEPSPDAFVVAAASLAASGQNTAAENVVVEGGLAAARSEAGASIGLRTEAITLLRDGYYRACEGYLNGVLDRTAYYAIVRRIDVLMVALVGIAAVGGTVVAPPVAIEAGANAGGGEELSAVADAAGAPVNVTVNSTPISSPQVAAEIRKIMELYHDLRREMFNEDLRNLRILSH